MFPQKEAVLSPCIGNQPAPYRGLSGPPGPKCRKSLENVSRAPGPQKVSNKSQESPASLWKSPESVWRVFLECSGPFWRLFGVPGPEAPRDIFETFSCISDLEVPRDFCKGRAGTQSLQLRNHPFDSLRSEVLSPLNFGTHEMEDPFATPQCWWISTECLTCCHHAEKMSSKNGVFEDSILSSALLEFALKVPSASEKLQDRKIVFGNSLKSCNALHDRTTYSQIFVFHVIYFDQN